MSTITDRIHNGQGSTSFGCARIAISPKGDVKPVVSACRSGYANAQGTWQLVQDGDYIFECSTSKNPKNGGDQCTVYVWQNGQENALSVTDQAAKWKWLDTLENSRAIADVLDIGYTCGRYSVFLPAGLGWDGENTLADKAKENRVRKFFAGLDKKTVDAIYAQAKTSHGKSLPTDWSTAGAMPGKLDFPAHSWTGALVDVDKYTSWVIWHRGGKVEYVENSPTEGRWGGNEAHAGTGSYHGECPDMPTTAVKAAKLSWGAHGLHHSRGISWELFAK